LRVTCSVPFKSVPPSTGTLFFLFFESEGCPDFSPSFSSTCDILSDVCQRLFVSTPRITISRFVRKGRPTFSGNSTGCVFSFSLSRVGDAGDSICSGHRGFFCRIRILCLSPQLPVQPILSLTIPLATHLFASEVAERTSVFPPSSPQIFHP